MIPRNVLDAKRITDCVSALLCLWQFEGYDSFGINDKWQFLGIFIHPTTKSETVRKSEMRIKISQRSGTRHNVNLT